MPKEKVTFYKSGLEAVVWNPSRNVPLAEFKKPNFTFTTEDPAVIEKLRELGYQEMPGVEQTEDGPQVARLRS